MLFHEYGHALACLSLFKNSNPTITIDPPTGGFTSYRFSNNKAELNTIATQLGIRSTNAIVAGAGIITELLFCYIIMIIAQSLRNKKPALASHLRFMMAFSVYSASKYAYFTEPDCNNVNDFCSLKNNVDISPTMAILFIVGSVLLLQFILSCTSALCTKTYTPKQSKILDLESQVNKHVFFSDVEDAQKMKNQFDSNKIKYN